jgi:hypothetical protein
MARSLNDILQNLLRNITSYYTATYSSDTDLYPILQMYGAELASGSLALETVRNNLFVITCEFDQLTNNFGTYFNQLKYFNQDYDEDRYISNSLTWSKSGSALTQRYSRTTYDQPFNVVAPVAENPWSFIYAMGPGQNYGKQPYVATVFSGSIIFAFFGQPAVYSNPYQGVYAPWRLSSYNPITNIWTPINTVYDITAGGVYLYGLFAHTPYLGRAQFASECLWAWDVYVTSLTVGPGSPIDTIPRIRLYEYNGDYVRTIHDSTTASTPLNYHVSDPTTAGWNATSKSVLFHDKIYIGWSHDDSSPHLVSYDPSADAFADYNLEMYADGVIGYSATTYNMHTPIVVHKNRVLVEVDYTSGSFSDQYIFAFDGANWVTLTAPSTINVSRSFVVFKDTLYALVNDNVMVYDDGTDTWSVHTNFNGIFPQDIFVFQNKYLLVSVNYGAVYYLNEITNKFVEFYQFDNNIKDTPHFFSELASNIYVYYQNGWYSSSFSSTMEWSYYWPAPNVYGPAVQNVVIPGYRKQLEFMLEAAVHGSTRKGITRTVNAFTLVNPDIREVYNLPQWQLKQEESNVIQLSTNTWQFTGTINFRLNEFAGAHVTLTSGSTPENKVAAGYLILVNDNNTITVGAIDDTRLLLKLVRPS